MRVDTGPPEDSVALLAATWCIIKAMRIRLVWICLLFAGVLRAAAFSVMTYNCKGNGAADWSANAAQVQAIGHQIMYLQPDIITFN